MKFDFFKQNISKLSNMPNGGMPAHFKLAPKLRKKYSEDFIASVNAKKAAVLVLFFPDKNGETCFALTKRARYKGTHSSQISFPGGKFEENDHTLQNTAIRETKEEIGVSIGITSLFKQMTNLYVPPSNYIVSPFLGYLNKTPCFLKNHEVEKIFQIRLSALLDDSSLAERSVSTNYEKNMKVPCFLLDGYMVWGATAMILNEIKEIIKEM